ncbi:hypothetical protein [Vulcaniibacterium tengchongense]|uniref:hypothetical protein n=1 Tax=Vulcaniibacterium tengchongense TaxID=1273429 RepID=UPI000F4DBD1C|nr:hypothetical protein [Vulcaniibacterium tengchongense]
MIAAVTFLASSFSALAQDGLKDYYFVWNGDQNLVANFTSESQWTRFGNGHESECDLEVNRAAAVAGTRDVVLGSGRKVFVPNMSRAQAHDLWVACMRSKGWEYYATEQDVVARRNQLRSQNIQSTAMAFSKSF